jgi:hypothetical protein
MSTKENTGHLERAMIWHNASEGCWLGTALANMLSNKNSTQGRRQIVNPANRTVKPANWNVNRQNERQAEERRWRRSQLILSCEFKVVMIVLLLLLTTLFLPHMLLFVDKGTMKISCLWTRWLRQFPCSWSVHLGFFKLLDIHRKLF